MTIHTSPVQGRLSSTVLGVHVWARLKPWRAEVPARPKILLEKKDKSGNQARLSAFIRQMGERKHLQKYIAPDFDPALFKKQKKVCS
jgi:hypothetical protein